MLPNRIERAVLRRAADILARLVERYLPGDTRRRMAEAEAVLLEVERRYTAVAKAVECDADDASMDELEAAADVLDRLIEEVSNDA